MANANLSAAKTAKNDEFYTELSEIQAELSHYSDKFAGKTVFCNCDDPFESNFVKYFLMNFNALSLKALIATGYPIRFNTRQSKSSPSYGIRVTSTKAYLQEKQADLDAVGVKRFLDKERNSVAIPLAGNWAKDKNGKLIQVSVREEYIDEKTGMTKKRTVKQDLYYEAGDFRSDMSIELLRQADIVVTNPPFSLFREYVAQLMQYEKQFLILGSLNAITYKEFFPLLKDDRVWLGYQNGAKIYAVSDAYAAEYPDKVFLQNGRYVIKMGNTGWFTNLDHAKRHQVLELNTDFVYAGHETDYPKYDNYNAIEVAKVSHIPCDYMGIMGVPITFLDKYCPEQFEIAGITLGNTVEYEMTKLYTDAIQHNKDGGIQSGAKVNTRAAILLNSKPDGIVYYTAAGVNGYLLSIYPRILIHKK